MIILDKTNYQNWRTCARYGWNIFNKKYDPYDEDEAYKFKEGYRVEKFALELFPNGHSISGEQAIVLKQTKDLIGRPGSKILYQATALSPDNFLAKADIIRVNEDKSLDLYEIKATGSPGLDGDTNTYNRTRFLHDIAFQSMVFQKSGYKIANLFLIYVNKEYVLGPAEIDLQTFFKIREVNDEAAELAEAVAQEAKVAQAAYAAKEEPVCDCLLKAQKSRCKTFLHFNPELNSENSILTISRIQAKKLAELRQQNILSVTDISEDLKETLGFSEKQQRQIEVAQSGRTVIKKAEIKQKLGQIKAPLYFLDYETINYAIPVLRKTRPYQQIPFQFSLYILKTPESEPVYYDYLMQAADEQEMANLIDHLSAGIGSEGSIIAWHAAAERGFQKNLGFLRPEKEEFFETLNQRLFDLETIFTSQAYMHPAFEGKTSLKKVLPVLVPSLNYSDLNIQEGSLASHRWDTALTETPHIKEQIFDDLRKYCQRDTLAMVEIYKHLKDL